MADGRKNRRYYSTDGQDYYESERRTVERDSYGYDRDDRYQSNNARRYRDDEARYHAQRETYSDQSRRRARRNSKKARARRRWRAAIVLALIIMLILIACIAGYFIKGHFTSESSVKTESYQTFATGAVEKIAIIQNEKNEISKIQESAASEQTDEPGDENSGDSNQQAAAPPSTGDNSGYTMVINRTYTIPANYIAGTGVLGTVEGIQMESEAAKWAQKLLNAIRADGLNLSIVSGYRSDDYQAGLYQRQIGKQGGNKEKAATISAVPMSSEHQAGLAMDVSMDNSLEQSFANTAQGKWMKEHCAEYGFILRYTVDKEMETGVIFEPWHFRFVGSPEEAQKIMASGLSMEEYYNKRLMPKDIDPYKPYLK